MKKDFDALKAKVNNDNAGTVLDELSQLTQKYILELKEESFQKVHISEKQVRATENQVQIQRLLSTLQWKIETPDEEVTKFT